MGRNYCLLRCSFREAYLYIPSSRLVPRQGSLVPAPGERYRERGQVLCRYDLVQLSVGDAITLRDQVRSDAVFVPLQAAARPLGGERLAMLDLEPLDEDRVGPVHILQPVAGRADGQKVGTDLREKMAGQRQAGGLGMRGGAQPAGDAPHL